MGDTSPATIVSVVLTVNSLCESAAPSGRVSRLALEATLPCRPSALCKGPICPRGCGQRTFPTPPAQVLQTTEKRLICCPLPQQTLPFCNYAELLG